MRVVYKEVGKVGEIREIEGTLAEFQEMCGGWIETLPLPADMVMLVNEEGKLKDLEPNIIVRVNNRVETIVGNLVVVSVKPHDGDFHGLEDNQIGLLLSTVLFEE